MSKPALDAIDRAIIERLSEDARMSNRAMGELLGVTEGTIRGRLKRLREAGLIRFTALTNLTKLGGTRIVFIRVAVDLGRMRAVAEAMAGFDELNCVLMMTGPHPILAMGPFRDFDTGVENVLTRIGRIEGVRGIETSFVLQAVKYNIRTAKIIPPQSGELLPDDSGDEG